MDDRYLYISDSGNNFGNRKNLKIIITGLLNKLTDINLIFDEIDYICKNPKSGIDFSFLREGYYRSKMKSHFIFYKINKIDNKIEIIRILYQRMDIENRLK
ncbi:MAG: type II toxin-antitoxin system RelE/ParE family toxin [Flavobacteriaceae bacterium]